MQKINSLIPFLTQQFWKKPYVPCCCNEEFSEAYYLESNFRHKVQVQLEIQPCFPVRLLNL